MDIEEKVDTNNENNIEEILNIYENFTELDIINQYLINENKTVDEDSKEREINLIGNLMNDEIT